MATNQGNIEVNRGAYVVGPLTVYRDTKINGIGRLSGSTKGATTLSFVLGSNEDAFTYSGNTFPEGGFELSNLSVSNRKRSPSKPSDILTSNNRGIWAVDESPSHNWNASEPWQQPKNGGNNCPKMKISNVIFERFTWAWDVHTWMTSFEDVEFRYCGGTRTYGTSVTFRRVWPQHNLYEAYQTNLQYSSMDACSLGEQKSPGDLKSNGIACYGGDIQVSNTGWENTYMGVVYRCVSGRIDVVNPKHVTDKTIKANYEYEIGSADAVITVAGFTKTRDTDGDITDASYNHALFYGPEGVENLRFLTAITEENLPYRYPHGDLSLIHI